MKFLQGIILFVVFLTSGVPAQKFRTLDYLKSISGVKTLSGQHNREPNAEPAKWTNQIFNVTGKYPALWSGDFLFEAENIRDRWTMIYEAKKQWESGSIINIMLHTCPPLQPEPCAWNGGVLSKLTDAQWTELITEGTQLNRNWKKRLDDISVYLQYLKDNEVEVMFRPLHEMGQGAFWWGGRPGPNGTLRLYQITHDYLTDVKGLDNLIWIWDVQDLTLDFADYNPGDKYWDIMALDVYGDGYNKKFYDYILKIAGNKPIAIGECDKLPTPQVLQEQPRYVFFMAWAELVFSKNTIQDINNLYSSARVVNRDQMPDLRMKCGFNTQPYNLSGTIEAENFDKCGEGVSYHDSDQINSKGAYRTAEAVDIEACTKGGYDVTDIKKGEWLAYTVNFDSSGVYAIAAEVSAVDTGKSFHIEIDGKNITGDIKIPKTGSGQNWQTVSVNSSFIIKGKKAMIVKMDSDGFSLNNLKFTLVNRPPTISITSPVSNSSYEYPVDLPITVNASDPDGSISKVEYFAGIEKIGENSINPFSYKWLNAPYGFCSLSAVATDNGGISVASAPIDFEIKRPQHPYYNDPYDIPGRIQAENFDLGGEGLAYHDLTPGNKFNVYRFEDADVEVCSDEMGGYSLGDFLNGEWVEYTVNILKTDVYNLELRIATLMTGTAISFEMGGTPITGIITIPNTGGWQNWQTITVNGIPLTAGKNVLRINCHVQCPNINYFTFVSAATGVQSDNANVPKVFALHQNYPNPFNPNTTIKFDLPESGFVTCRVYDALGREAATIINQEMNAGYHTVGFNAEKLSSGLYFCKIQAGSHSAVMKMVLVK